MPDKEFWNQRYANQNTGWDIGKASPALLKYCAENVDPTARILIPGCGNAHEFGALISLGYTDIRILDISDQPIQRLKEAYPEQSDNIILGDFFEHQGCYDLILEQTFFCAIDPSRRMEYVLKMRSLLAEKGRIAGLLFDLHFDKEGPPFGGSEEEYRQHFNGQLEILRMEKCLDSIAPRQGSELFFELRAI